MVRNPAEAQKSKLQHSRLVQRAYEHIEKDFWRLLICILYRSEPNRVM